MTMIERYGEQVISLPITTRNVRSDDTIRSGDYLTCHYNVHGLLVWRRTRPGETRHAVALTDAAPGGLVSVLAEEDQ